MREVHLITIGKLRDKAIETLESEYLKRINQFKFIIHESKAFSEDLEKESIDLVPAIAVRFFWLLCLLRHGVSITLLKQLNLYRNFSLVFASPFSKFVLWMKRVYFSFVEPACEYRAVFPHQKSVYPLLETSAGIV